MQFCQLEFLWSELELVHACFSITYTRCKRKKSASLVKSDQVSNGTGHICNILTEHCLQIRARQNVLILGLPNIALKGVLPFSEVKVIIGVRNIFMLLSPSVGNNINNTIHPTKRGVGSSYIYLQV